MKGRKKQIGRSLILGLLILTFAAGCSQERAGSGQAQKENVKKEKVEEVSQKQEESEAEAETDLSKLYVITKLDVDNQIIAFEDLAIGKSFQYPFSKATYFYDKYGKSVSAGSDHIFCGEVVTFQLSAETQKLEWVRVNTDVWQEDAVTDFEIDPDRQLLSFYDTQYYYGSHYWVFSNNQKIGLDQISDMDELCITGTDRKILSIVVKSGHGRLTLTNTDLFVKGFLKVGKMYREIAPDMSIDVPEGVYDMTVANQGYGDTKEIEIVRDRELIVDLEEFRGEGPKKCVITFKVNVEGAVLKLDGEQVDYSQAIEIQYGSYVLTLEAEGYQTLRKRLVVGSESAEIDIQMNDQDSETESAKSGTSSVVSHNAKESLPTAAPDTSASAPRAGSLAGSLAGDRAKDAGTANKKENSVTKEQKQDKTSQEKKDEEGKTGISATTTDNTVDDETKSAVSTLLDLLTDKDD